MRVSNYPHIFQGKMNKISCEFELIWAYIHELFIINNFNWYDHLDKLELILQNIKYNRFKCNIKKSLFGLSEREYLGFWVTRNGLRTINKKYKPYESTKKETPCARVHSLSKLI